MNFPSLSQSNVEIHSRTFLQCIKKEIPNEGRAGFCIEVPSAMRDGFDFGRSGNNVIQTFGINRVLRFKYILRGADKNGDVLLETLVVDHERSSAAWLASAAQSSVCHGSLSSAVPPVIEHEHSSDEFYIGPPRPPGFGPMTAKFPSSSAERPGSATQSSVSHGSFSNAVPPVIEHEQSSDGPYPGPPRPPDYPSPGFGPKPSSADRPACLPASPGPDQPRPFTINCWQTWRKEIEAKMLLACSSTLSSSASLGSFAM